MNNNWIYYGIFFGSDVKNELLNIAKNYAGISEDWKVYCDHMTLVYNDKSEEKQKRAEHYEQFLGKQYTVIIDAIGISKEAIALRVSNCKSQNKVSHITIATAPGVKPVRSNNIERWFKLPQLYSATGTINVVLKNI